ncbi:MAG: DsbA family protein [Acetobacteraceae bacterium]
MFSTRRELLTLVLAGTTAGAFAAAGSARAEDMTRTERSLGKPDAPVTVTEFFSLTCSHCAAFSVRTMPKVKQELIDTGKIRFVYRDYPLDQIALMGAMVARHLPPERYAPFVSALLASQDRWVFNRGVNPMEELWKMAALAGMSRETFDKAINDTALRDWILQQQQADQEKWKIDSTPSFVINGQKYSGDMSFEAFRKLIPG